MIKSYLDSINLIGDDAKIIKEDCVFTYKDYSYNIPAERLAKYPNDNKIIMRMLLRYASIISTSQQWNLPHKWYEDMVNSFNATIEGFASPLNSQLMIIMPKGEAKFCSLFPDTDEPFGSLGSIFELNSKTINDKVIINNPPYVLEIMNKLMKVQMKWLEIIPITIIMSVPAWKDAEYFHQAINNKYLVYEEEMKSNQHYYETIKEGEVVKITARFPSYMFMFSNKDVNNVKKMTKMWRN